MNPISSAEARRREPGGLGATEPMEPPSMPMFGAPPDRNGFMSDTKPPFRDKDEYPMVPPTTMPHNFPNNFTVNNIEPKKDKNGLTVIEIPRKEGMTLPEVDMSFPPKFPTVTHQPSHHNDIFVKPNVEYIDQELHPLYVQTQNLISDLYKERLKRTEEDNNRQMSMAQMELEKRKHRERLERQYRQEIEKFEKQFNEIAADKTKKFLELWQRRFAEEKKTWKETMERMHEREKYLTIDDDVLISDNIAHKLNAQVIQDIADIDMKIYEKENDVQAELNRLKNEGVKADIEYNELMDEIDK